MTIKKQLLLELNNTKPELLSEVYNFFKFLQSNKTKSPSKKNGHPLKNFSGILSDSEAKKMKKLVSAEFSVIEGDWN